MSFASKQEAQLMDEFIDRTVMHWIRIILARQPGAEFVFLATKEDLLNENKVTKKLLTDTLKAKLASVEQVVKEMKTKLMKKELEVAEPFSSRDFLDINEIDPSLMFVSCMSETSVRSVRHRIEELIVTSEQSFRMTDTYSLALEAIINLRTAATSQEISTRINAIFTPVDKLIQQLAIEPDTCRPILETLHDLGDVLWYKDLGVDFFHDTVILDPLLLINFIRQVINHNYSGQTLPHTDLNTLPYWVGLSNHEQMKALKQVLHEFHLVYPADDDRIMQWDSDLIVPAYWQTKTPAAWLFLGDILRINTTGSCEGEAVRVHWEYHFEFGLPRALFDHMIVASVSPYVTFDAGPDWILYEEKELAACRILIGRDAKSLHPTIHVEAVVSDKANQQQVDDLWRSFEHVGRAFMEVMGTYPGLLVSSFAWDDKHHKIGLKRVLQTKKASHHAVSWMPPAKTLQVFKL